MKFGIMVQYRFFSVSRDATQALSIDELKDK